jgi:hypothetical protein
MANSENLEGTTLNVYACMIKENRPMGPRETMRLANLSSPSVAYWHLQKLESLGLIYKDEYGEYAVKEKVNISGYFWVGNNLVPRLIFYAFFFIGILIIEITVIAAPFIQYNQVPDAYMFYLMAPTIIAMALFLSEGIWLRKKTQIDPIKKKSAKKSQT